MRADTTGMSPVQGAGSWPQSAGLGVQVQPPAASAVLRRPVTVLTCLVVFGLGYLFSTWLLDVYRGGDQEHYANFWQAMSWTHPSQWTRLQVQYLSSSEPLYRFVIGFGTYFDFDRIRYLSLWNALLLSSVAYCLLKERASFVFSLLVFSNYYLLVILGPAERLKFAYLLLILAACVSSVKAKGVLSLASIFAHNQAFVQFVSAVMYFIAKNRQQLFKSRLRTLLFLTVGPVVAAAAIYIMVASSGDVISQKADYYGEQSQGVIEVVQWFLILLCGMIVFDKRLQFFVGMLPMGFLTSLYGGRINVATLAFFVSLSLSLRKTTHPLVLAVMAYMSFKSIGFIINVLDTGQGF